MLTVAKNEFFKNLKTAKSILIILLFVFLSYFMTKYLKGFLGDNSNGFYSTLKFLIFILGYIFVATLSHDSINKEIELQTIRLITTKISKTRFLLGKVIGVVLFWIVCIFINFLIISILAKTFNIESLILLMACMFYYICLVILISSIISNTTLSNFLGIFIGFILPSLGIYLTSSYKIYSILKWIFPYIYIEKGGFYIIGVFVLSSMFIITSIKILNKKDV